MISSLSDKNLNEITHQHSLSDSAKINLLDRW